MQEETSNNDQKPCRQCALPIPVSAKLCSRCASYQDWRGELAVSSTVLALLVALISVGTAAVPVITKAIEQNESKVKISNFVLRDLRISAVATNTGQRPATIAEVAIHGGGTLLLTSPQTRDDTYLPSGSKQVVFDVQPRMSASTARRLAELPKGELKADGSRVLTIEPLAQVEFFVANSDGSGSIHRFPINLIDLGRPLVAHAERCDTDPSYRRSGVCAD